MPTETRTIAFRTDEVRSRDGYVEADLSHNRIRDLYRQVIHAEHTATVAGVVDDLVRRIKEGEIADNDALSDALPKACDGVLIYTADIREFLDASDNETAYFDEMGRDADADNELARGAFALMADVREELHDRGYGYKGEAWDADDCDDETTGEQPTA